MPSGFGRTEIVIGIAGIIIAAVAVLWLLGDALYGALQEDGGLRIAEWLGFAVGLIGGLVVNEYARGRLQERGLDQAASGLAILLGVGTFLALYGMVMLIGHALSA